MGKSEMGRDALDRKRHSAAYGSEEKRHSPADEIPRRKRHDQANPLEDVVPELAEITEEQFAHVGHARSEPTMARVVPCG